LDILNREERLPLAAGQIRIVAANASDSRDIDTCTVAVYIPQPHHAILHAVSQPVVEHRGSC